jgi:glycine/D-amino acid oxidase-like deaminating enzyme
MMVDGRTPPLYDVVIIGGGWFGCAIADYLRPRYPRILIVERESDILLRASYTNQARIHNGYHYPRSLQTAYRSRINFEIFSRDYADAVVRDFVKLYCIAARNSKVSPRQFERFCNLIGAEWKAASKDHRALFQPQLIASVYEVKECAFNSRVLAAILWEKLRKADVEVRLNTRVMEVAADGGHSRILLSDGSEVEAGMVFNCTYSGLKRIPGLEEHCHTGVKHEITEMVLVDMPEDLKKIGVTVMDGAFFSTMPFPSRGLHTLSHVRYTPHGSWTEAGTGESPDPYALLAQYAKESKAIYMQHDAARYMPALARARVVDTLFEVKTILVRNELDDGRPILMERSKGPQIVYSVLGGKIDNIYDVLYRLEADGL